MRYLVISDMTVQQRRHSMVSSTVTHSIILVVNAHLGLPQLSNLVHALTRVVVTRVQVHQASLKLNGPLMRPCQLAI